MTAEISEIAISSSDAEEIELKDKKFIKIDVKLRSSANMYLWYKQNTGASIFAIQFSFSKDMASALDAAKFKKINKNIYLDSGHEMYLWYSTDEMYSGTPIEKLAVTRTLQDEVKLFRDGWERLSCDLTRFSTSEHSVYVWVKRRKQVFISELYVSLDFSEAKDLLNDGKLCTGEDTNRDVKPAVSPVFIWYKLTTKKDDSINSIDVALSPDEVQELKEDGYKKIDTNLKTGTREGFVYLMNKPRKPGQDSVIHSLTVLVGDEARDAYKNAGFNIIDKNLNNAVSAVPLFLAHK